MASTCTARSPNRASSSELWTKTLQHREQASNHRTRSSRYTALAHSTQQASCMHRVLLHTPCICMCVSACDLFCFVCMFISCNPITSVGKLKSQEVLGYQMEAVCSLCGCASMQVYCIYIYCTSVLCEESL